MRTATKSDWRGIGGLYKDYTAFLLALRTGELNDESER